MSNRIVKRIYYAIKIRTESPLNVTGSESVYSDADVICNGNGEYYIPGTSLAGAFRNYLGEAKDQESMMGFCRKEIQADKTEKDVGKMSTLFISDLYFSTPPVVSLRDGVSLDEGKGVENKFDMQIIETGAKGMVYITGVVRETDRWEPESQIGRLVEAMKSGEIRLGKNKNRGFGKIFPETVYKKVFVSGGEKADSLDAWLSFCEGLSRFRAKEAAESSAAHGESDIDDALKGLFGEPETMQEPSREKKYVHIKVPLRLTGGISIRRYSTVPGKADYEHLTCHNLPVIPGSSWNGAIRARALRILRDLGCKDASEIIKTWFGTAGKDEDVSWQSMVVFSESILEGSKTVPMTRNKINRFTSGTVESALYTELSCIGGHTALNILVRKEDGCEELVSLLLIVLKELSEGRICIGGLGAVGRGIFESDGDIVVDGADVSACGQAFYRMIIQRKEGDGDEVE